MFKKVSFCVNYPYTFRLKILFFLCG